MFKKIKKIIELIKLIFLHTGSLADEAVKNGICDFSGQGHDRFGR